MVNKPEKQSGNSRKRTVGKTDKEKNVERIIICLKNFLIKILKREKKTEKENST